MTTQGLPEEIPDLDQQPQGDERGHQGGEPAEEESPEIFGEVTPRGGVCRFGRR